MAFEEPEKRRTCEIICEEIQNSNTSTVTSRDILARLREEDIHPGPGEMDAYLTQLRESWEIVAALPFGREEIEEHGNVVITSFSTEFMDIYGR